MQLYAWNKAYTLLLVCEHHFQRLMACASHLRGRPSVRYGRDGMTRDKGLCLLLSLQISLIMEDLEVRHRVSPTPGHSSSLTCKFSLVQVIQ